ncbi:MAG: hypothetical protein EHM64_05790 [Ignavibacteriae bacterium]|nr:MAG: hypothetical protein EHM64_05790 [Ignavibacteriota bacterium]
MIKKYLAKVILVISLTCSLGVLDYQPLQAQVFGPQTVKWLWVSSLRQYFSSAGSEIEYGRRGRGPYLNTDQNDGLRWPAQYQNQDHNIGKSLWIGTTNFTDPTNGITYPNKVVHFGRATMYVNAEIYPEEFRLYGKFAAPAVTVDNLSASDLDANDLDLGGGDVVDASLPADRMIYNRVNTPIGITVYRKVLAFTQQYHDNYYIYEYTFKNTGFTDNNGGRISPVKTLTDVVFDFRYRLGNNQEGYIQAWTYAGVSWGLNTINDAVGQDAAHTLPAPNDKLKAVFSYYGPHSGNTSGLVPDDIGAPNFIDGHILGAPGFPGEVLLHADTSPNDATNDLTQPRTTFYMGSDGNIETLSPSTQFNANLMTQQYTSMTAGHPARTQAEQIGQDAHGYPTAFSNTWGGNTGGYSIQQGIGPYTMQPGDSVRIVIGEAVAGISRSKNAEVARNWFAWYQNGRTGTTQLPLPAGYVSKYGGPATTTDGNEYKNAWVFSGKDSLFQSFRRATANYQSNYNIPQPPPPPDRFSVLSGGDRISLSWSKSAESWPNFDGYRVYRAETKTDTVFELIYSCNKANATNAFDDVTARRGFNYFYYIQTKDDGSTNDIQPGEPLVSSIFYTMTNAPASLQRPAAKQLAEIRVVPNPYNIKAKSIQYGTDRSVENRLAFFGLPKKCIIKIYTETGDLIQTINHVNGSGDETWNSLTSSNQLVVSGLYIAYFEVTEDDTNVKKGDNTFRKFIIIR